MADRFAIFVRDDWRCKKVSTAARLILYALASRADAKGYCWPSVATIASDTGMSRATIYRNLPEVRCVLTVDAPGFKHSNSYIFPYVEAKKCSVGSGVVDMMPTDVDKVSQNATGGTSQNENASIKLRQCKISKCDGKSQNEKNDVSKCDVESRKMRPEVEREDTQEDSLSLLEGKKYDGMRKPKNRDEVETIKKWCWNAMMDMGHINEFIRINRLAHWKNVDETTSVKDLIHDFVEKWKRDDWVGYCSFVKRRGGDVTV